MGVNLTQRTVKTLAVPERGQKAYFDDTLRGFALRVSAHGVRTFVVTYRHAGKFRWYTLGSAEVLDVAEARKRARVVLGDVATGVDPAAVRQEQKRAAVEEVARGDTSFGTLIAFYLDEYARKRKRSWKLDEWTLKRKEIKPLWSRPALSLTQEDMADALEAIVAAGKPMAAVRTRAVLSRVFSFAIEHRQARGRFRVTHNPVASVGKLEKNAPRERVLTADELRAVWAALERESDPDARAIFQLVLYTMQRGGEVKAMRREDVDFIGSSGFRVGSVTG